MKWFTFSGVAFILYLFIEVAFYNISPDFGATISCFSVLILVNLSSSIANLFPVGRVGALLWGAGILLILTSLRLIYIEFLFERVLYASFREFRFTIIFIKTLHVYGSLPAYMIFSLVFFLVGRKTG